MSSDFDEGSFPKVRGWLLAFSSGIILLWFFGADLTTVSVLGTSIGFTRNTEYVWLVAFVINLYLALRFYQHQPHISCSSLPIYKRYYEALMIKFVLLTKRQIITERLFNQNGRYSSLELKDRLVNCVIEKADFKTFHSGSETRRYTKGLSQRVVCEAHCLIRNEEGKVESTSSQRVGLDCPYVLIFTCVWLAKIKVWITTSYATEHLLPYFWSGFAAVVCLCRWHAAVTAVTKWCV